VSFANEKMKTACCFLGLRLAVPGVTLVVLNIARAASPAGETDIPGKCGDSIIATARIDPKLESRLFKTTETRYSWHIITEDGSLSDTIDHRVDAQDLSRIEITARCTSSHQGPHLMEFCEAVATADGVKLEISGGLPAYASTLSVMIDPNRRFTCAFGAVYPAPTNPLRWVITKKSLRLKSAHLAPGSRLHGWISVEFEEIDQVSGGTRSYKIEGYFKPVILSAPNSKPAIARAETTPVVLPDAQRFAANARDFLVESTVPGCFETPEGIVWALLSLSDQNANPNLSSPFLPKAIESTSGAKGARPLAAYFRGAHLKGTTLTVAFSGDAMRYLNSTTAIQQVVKGSIETTLKKHFPSVTTIEYEIDGKTVTGWDA
jgi:hypothetical protein